ncbi:GNAT family N-acetyltransferase [Paenibacillus whitsoniae]|uniref:GNAT family N-acetyltransferase n=1 Tax=Paenibacillus whitsoniae TaxID=2496558 RepID=A0A3S0A7U0_9BACL|nr:GNAT family N-acetyltransferase [Paenibacillus whitsoniae]RTE11707.1 GNAT family N-acetyltransferase [Paenibacillus whitsoniae]
MEIRPVSENEMEQAVRLSDTTFRTAGQPSMLEAFLSAFDARLGQSIGAFDGERLVAFMGLVPSVVAIGQARVSVLSLGSVCTHPEYRGRKIASAMLQEVVAAGKRAGASLLLVSGDGPLYMRHGCRYFGRVTKFRLKAQELRSLPISHPAVVVRTSSLDDLFRLHGLAAQREVRYEQSVLELATLIKCEAIASCYRMRHTVYAAFEGDRMRGFAVIAAPPHGGSLHEQPPFVVERSGEAEVDVALLRHAAEDLGLVELEVQAGWYETELQDALAGYPQQAGRNHGTALILDAGRLYSELHPYLASKAPEAAERISFVAVADGGASVLLDGEEQLTLTGDELMQLWWDPQSEVQAPTSVEGELRTLFPVPFPHAGGLNFV